MPIATRRARDPCGAGIVTWRFTWISDGTAYPVRPDPFGAMVDFGT